MHYRAGMVWAVGTSDVIDLLRSNDIVNWDRGHVLYLWKPPNRTEDETGKPWETGGVAQNELRSWKSNHLRKIRPTLTRGTSEPNTRARATPWPNRNIFSLVSKYLEYILGLHAACQTPTLRSPEIPQAFLRRWLSGLSNRPVLLAAVVDGDFSPSSVGPWTLWTLGKHYKRVWKSVEPDPNISNPHWKVKGCHGYWYVRKQGCIPIWNHMEPYGTKFEWMQLIS